MRTRAWLLTVLVPSLAVASAGLAARRPNDPTELPEQLRGLSAVRLVQAATALGAGAR